MWGHGIAYNKYKDKVRRNIADLELQEKARKCITAKDSSFGERAAAVLTTGAIYVKRKIGGALTLQHILQIAKLAGKGMGGLQKY